jgi:hypothetical protein
MMISSPSAGDPYAAAASLDRALRSGNEGGDADASASESTTLDASPDVVVTLSQGLSSPTTYNAAGRMSGRPTLDDLGANGPGSLVHATESADDGDATSSASDATNADADADADTAVPA